MTRGKPAAMSASPPGESVVTPTTTPVVAWAPRLLVVDDDAVDRMAVRRTLAKTSLGAASVQEVSSADAALTALAGAVFDCVLLDYDLAGTTGLEVLRRMTQRRMRVPVVMLTGRSDAETAAALIKGGASDFLSKENLSPERLEQAIQGALRMAAVERELETSRERFEITLQGIADAVVGLDVHGRITYLNPAAERLTGWPRVEATGRRLEDVAFVVTADEVTAGLRGTLLHDRARQVLAGERMDERSDMTLIARDGTQLYVDATVSPLRDASGGLSGAVVALRDITARKMAEAGIAAANRELSRQATRLEEQAAELEQQSEELSQQVDESQAIAAELEQASERLLEAHAETERSEVRYRALVEASSQLVWTTDARGMVEDMPGWRALTGQSVEEVRGTGWLDALHPDDRERSARAWSDACEAKTTYVNEYRLRLRDGSYRWQRARGVPVLDAHGSIREWVGTLVDIDEEHRAEEARREEADLIETLHRISGVLTSELDVERLVQTVTDAATGLTGAQFGAFFYNVVDTQGAKLTLYTLSGAPRSAFENFGHPRPTPVFAPTFYGQGIVRSDDITKDPRYGQMGPHHGMPPKHLPVRSYLAVPVVSRHGEVIGGLFFGHADAGVFTDRSERLASGIASSAAVAMDNARLYEAERRARAEAQTANKAKSDFLANMSHELRTPLNAIGGYADLMLEGIRGPITEAQRADLERIRRSQHHLLSLINDILNFAKIEAGHVRFDPRDVLMQPALEELETLIQPQLRAKRLQFEQQCAEAHLTAYVDGERLRQILLNLLSNALKFTEAGGTIRLQCEAVGDDLVTIRVSDTGVGMPADKLEHIFEPFVQLERGPTAREAGTGLGLAISRDLARAMGGELRAESRLDEGSTFTLTLPRRRGGATA